jgi:hypothetical protein
MATSVWISGTAYKTSETEFLDQEVGVTGNMITQTVEFRRWSGTSEEPLQRVHRFTFSKAGYVTLVYENQAVNGPITWNIEVQQQKQPPSVQFDER